MTCDGELIDTDTLYPCWICQRPTQLVSISFETAMCSIACLNEADRRFWQALSEDSLRRDE
jgi:hypothetical protein